MRPGAEFAEELKDALPLPVKGNQHHVINQHHHSGVEEPEVEAAEEEAVEEEAEEQEPAFRAGQQFEARREMVLAALRTVFAMHNEECSLSDLQTQLRASHPHETFERAEIDAILAQLEEENVVMYREGQILRI